MFEPPSRYYNIADAIYEDEDGHQIAYKRRRFLPPGEALPVLAEVTVHESDRLDLIAARTRHESVRSAGGTRHPGTDSAVRGSARQPAGRNRGIRR